MDDILKQILLKLDKLEEGQNRHTEAIEGLAEGQDKITARLDRIDQKLDAISEQTAGLMEFRSETLQYLDILAGKVGKHSIDIEYLKFRKAK